jgi:type IV pilus assembly protein PilW
MHARRPTPLPAGSASRSHKRQLGFTIVELLVALALAVLVLSMVAVVFAGTSRNRDDLERSSRLAENAHYGIDLLTDEIQHAGYYAEMVTASAAWQVPDPCSTTLAAQGWAYVPFTVPVPLAGYRAGDAAPACLTARKPGTAIMVVRHASIDTTLPAAASGGAFLQVSKCVLDLKTWVVSDVPADFTLHNIDCVTTADVRQLLVRTYFVATCNVCGTDTIPTLKRAELVGTAIVVTPLAEGVESVQIEYGFDADNDGKPDRFLTAPDAALGAAYGDWSNVMGVRLYALFRSTDVQPGYVDVTKRFNLGPAGFTEPAADGYRRLELSSLAVLKGPAGRREVP